MKTKAFPIAWKCLFDYNKLIHRMHPDCLQAGDHSMRGVNKHKEVGRLARITHVCYGFESSQNGETILL